MNDGKLMVRAFYKSRWEDGKEIPYDVRIEPDTSEVSGNRMARAVEKFIEIVKYRITITPDVEIAGIGELPRFELKAKRLIRE